MSKSLLGSVINDLIEEDEKAKFIDKIHAETGISKEKLGEAYDADFNSIASQNPVSWAKSRVYKLINNI